MSAKVGARLRGAGFGVVPFPREEIMRAVGRDALKKIGERGEARVAVTLVVEEPSAEKVEFRPMEGVAVDLAMIELDGADGLGWREAARALAHGRRR